IVDDEAGLRPVIGAGNDGARITRHGALVSAPVARDGPELLAVAGDADIQCVAFGWRLLERHLEPVFILARYGAAQGPEGIEAGRNGFADLRNDWRRDPQSVAADHAQAAGEQINARMAWLRPDDIAPRDRGDAVQGDSGTFHTFRHSALPWWSGA